MLVRAEVNWNKIVYGGGGGGVLINGIGPNRLEPGQNNGEGYGGGQGGKGVQDPQNVGNGVVLLEISETLTNPCTTPHNTEN